MKKVLLLVALATSFLFAGCQKDESVKVSYRSTVYVGASILSPTSQQLTQAVAAVNKYFQEAGKGYNETFSQKITGTSDPNDENLKKLDVMAIDHINGKANGLRAIDFIKIVTDAGISVPQGSIMVVDYGLSHEFSSSNSPFYYISPNIVISF